MPRFLVCLTALLLAAPIAARAETATLELQLVENMTGPVVVNFFGEKSPGSCKAKRRIASISHGNPFVRTKGNEGFPVPAGTEYRLFVSLVPPGVANTCQFVGAFTPDAGGHYVLTAVFDLQPDRKYNCGLVLEKKSGDTAEPATLQVAPCR
ncbi:hypothetical protein N790_10145 [Arenimonas malthae CC-JY-1]|uniref:Uncharacterized protein n=1 Tax=Arenimonas malthae CC-JY-1 TaxID=1384054 RepID=A0A091B395_9GAMM|nr:hypothetical protein [Arenimonas malthae]KFN45334.1 hypothetical protein N790_10145 [Arenimonas malthae CC-JY-1]